MLVRIIRASVDRFEISSGVNDMVGYSVRGRNVIINMTNELLLCHAAIFMRVPRTKQGQNAA